MGRIFAVLYFFIIIGFLNNFSSAQTAAAKKPQTTSLISDELVIEGRELDKQLLEINNRMQEIIIKYNLMSTGDIKFVPYRVRYILGDNYIGVIHYEFKKEDQYSDKITGVKERSIKIFVSGGTVSRIESVITDKDIGRPGGTVVSIMDPSPTAEGTDDIVFSHKVNNRKFIDNKPLGEIKNNRAFPVRNTIKREFLIPHNTFVYDTILKIAELYYGVLKDTDNTMADFLKKTSRY